LYPGCLALIIVCWEGTRVGRHNELQESKEICIEYGIKIMRAL
jgi:hypothetical protein